MDAHHLWKRLDESIPMLEDLLRDSVGDTMAWEDTTSPQYRALEWLVNENEWTAARMEDGNWNIPIQILVERYALLVLYFALQEENGENEEWGIDMGLLDAKLSSCDWYAIRTNCFDIAEPHGAVCDGGFVSGLSLRKSSCGCVAKCAPKN
eukprot:scaffold7064_cov111-Cylindrotheca_fusiformis.AAC.4